MEKQKMVFGVDISCKDFKVCCVLDHQENTTIKGSKTFKKIRQSKEVKHLAIQQRVLKISFFGVINASNKRMIFVL